MSTISATAAELPQPLDHSTSALARPTSIPAEPAPRSPSRRAAALIQDPALRPSIAGATVCLGLLVALFWSNLRYFVGVWAADPNYSHGFLVPLMSLYFADEAAGRSPRTAEKKAIGGVLLGVGLLWISVLGAIVNSLVPVGIVAGAAFIVGLAGICSLLFGAGTLRRQAFPLFFLSFMIPLPINLYTRIASPLQLWVSRLAAFLLNAFGMPVLVEGNLITLPGDLRMFVAEACSGMRQLTGFLALTFAFAYLARRPFWYRAALVASAVPIALTANVARVTLTGWIMTVDPRLASGAFHTLEGLLMMGFGLALLLLERQALDSLARRFESPRVDRALGKEGGR